MQETEHVGVKRSVAGNLAHIMGRFTPHTKALASLLPLGLALRNRANTAAALHLYRLYATPVLMSGMGTLILTKSEVKMIDQYVKTTLQKLQKLVDKTPSCVIFFLGGVRPGIATLHLRQLSLFGMNARSPKSILNNYAITRLLVQSNLGIELYVSSPCIHVIK